jgi:hypothetical protein
VINQHIGTSELALMADHLAIRGRIGLAVLAAEFALDHLRPLPSFPVAQEAFDLAKRSFDGEFVDPDRFEDAVHDERHHGIAICAIHAKSKREISAWLTIQSALLYIASHVYRAVGQLPGPQVSEVDEHILDHLDKDLRAISPAGLKVLAKAAGILERNEGLSFAQLKAAIRKI